jgi:hypothetical protein
VDMTYHSKTSQPGWFTLAGRITEPKRRDLVLQGHPVQMVNGR